MRKQLLRAVGALGVILGMTSLASAASLPGTGWYTTAVIQNVGVSAATVQLSVYQQSSLAAPQSVSITPAINPGASRVFFPGSGGAGGNVDLPAPGLPSGFNGSMVVLSDQPVVAIGQITNFQVSGFPVGTPGGYASEQFRGSPANTSSISFPTVKSSFGGKTTIFTVQAAGADVNATATIVTADGVSHSKQFSIGANRSATFGPADGFSPGVQSTNCAVGGVLSPNNSPCFGSLVVSGNNNIAGVAVEYTDGVSPAQAVQAATMFGSDEAGSTVLCPIIKNNYGGNHRTTGLSVGNTGGTVANVTATFRTSTGQTYARGPEAIAPGKSFVFGADSNTIGGMPAGSLASATVTSDKPSIVAVVSERNIQGSPVKFTTYNCFNQAAATAKVAAPVVKQNFNGNTTGIQVQNANTSGALSVTATYACDSGASTYTVSSTSLTPGQSTTFFQPSQVPSSKLCAVTLDAGANNHIVAVVNESSDLFPTAPTFKLNTKNYEGFNL